MTHLSNTLKLSLLLLLMAVSCSQKQSNQEHVEPITDKIQLLELDGHAIDLRQYKDKAVFINLWATWCGPCVKEMPSIERAKNKLKESNIEFLVASNETVEQIQSFIAKRKLDLHYVQLQNMEELGIPALPTTYVIDPKGELVFSETGSREWDAPANIELLTKIINKND